MKVRQIAYSDAYDGASRAAGRLRNALIHSGLTCTAMVRVKWGDEASVLGPNGLTGKLFDRVRLPLGKKLLNKLSAVHYDYHSANLLPSRLASVLNESDVDVVNLHWVGGETLSIEDIGRLRKPLVWTLHDMWPFCGTEHYAPDDIGARWRTGYQRSERLPGDSGLDMDRWVWRRKRAAWKHPMQIVAPSSWLAACARESALFRNWPITVIPNVLDTARFQPLEQAFCRRALGLPSEGRIVLFGAMGGGRDSRKGFELLLEALSHLGKRYVNPEIMCVVFGGHAQAVAPAMPFPVRWIGQLNDDFTLALLYNAADVMVVPSRQENLPQTATEPQACGCPVVAFDCTGFRDVVVHRETGYLARAFDTEEMAEGLHWILENADLRNKMGGAARARALSHWTPEIVVPKYLRVFQDAIDMQSAG